MQSQPAQPAAPRRPAAAASASNPAIAGDVETSERSVRLLIVGGALALLALAAAGLLALFLISQRIAF